MIIAIVIMSKHRKPLIVDPNSISLAVAVVVVCFFIGLMIFSSVHLSIHFLYHWLPESYASIYEPIRDLI